MEGGAYLNVVRTAPGRFRVERPQNSVRILFVIDDPLVVFGGWRRWRVERPQNSVRNRRPSRGFRRVAALARGAS